MSESDEAEPLSELADSTSGKHGKGPKERDGVSSGRSFERLINLSDAVVAVAITLNILPIIEIRPAEGESIWTVLKEDGGQVLSFVYTFLIVGVMWTTHNRILNRMRGYDTSIFWLNLLWLLLIVLLPWPTAMFGGTMVFEASSGGGDAAGITMFYWGTLAAISATGTLMGLRCRMRPELLVDPESARQTDGQVRGWAYTAFFLLIGVVSLFSSSVSNYLPLGLIVLVVILKKSRVD